MSSVEIDDNAGGEGSSSKPGLMGFKMTAKVSSVFILLFEDLVVTCEQHT